MTAGIYCLFKACWFMLWIPWFWLSSIECQDLNFEFHIVKHVCCFNLAVLENET